MKLPARVGATAAIVLLAATAGSYSAGGDTASASSSLSQTLTLQGPKTIHRGARVTLMGELVMQLDPDRCAGGHSCPPFLGVPVAVYSRPDRKHRFTRIGRVWPKVDQNTSDPSGLTESFTWRLTVRPGRNTIYLAASQATPPTYAPAQSRPLRIHVVR